MKPDSARMLDVFAVHLMTKVAPALPHAYQQSDVSALGIMLLAVKEETERAASRRVEENAALRRLFETVVEACIASGLVGGDGFSVDASLIKADVNPARRVAGNEAIDWPDRAQASRAVREYLIALDEESAEARYAAGGRTECRLSATGGLNHRTGKTTAFMR